MMRAMFMTGVALVLVACGSGSTSPNAAPPSGTGGSVGGACNFTIAATPQALTAQEVERVLAQGIEASAKINAKATLAVVDRVGNVLGVYRMNGASTTIDILSGSGKVNAASPQGLDGLSSFIPAELAAISKALTGAYLSSSGNAFSTRTASFIVQEHFVPGISQTAGGPLFGVQFSQLPCGDLVTRGAGIGVGPKRSPLGLSADPGGFPLYKNGRVVGGIGVVADGVYGLDPSPTTSGADLDEQLAMSAQKGFAPPECIRGDRITAGGVSLAYTNSDAQIIDTAATSLSASNIAALGALLPVSGYFSANATLTGTAFGEPASGISADTADFQSVRGYLLGNPSANVVNRYPPTASTTPTASAAGMNANEVKTILQQALGVANQARAQIRAPVGSPVEVTVTVIDAGGNVLGLVRTPDAPVFGIDVALQKARTAAFFSSNQAANLLSQAPDVGYFNGKSVNGNFVQSPLFRIDSYLSAQPAGARNFFANSSAFADGKAFSVRAVGNIARPFFPDGIDGNPQGPFSKAFSSWSPFNVGLQLDLIYTGLVTAILDPANTNNNCTNAAALSGLRNGMQTFPGGFPIYRGNTLIGAIGVSGDGVDQDDMVGLLGLARAANILNTGVGNAPAALRADTLAPQGRNLRYAQCPQAPFNNSNEQGVCNGI